MLAFFRCIGESVAAKGVASLAREIPLGNYLLDVARDALARFKSKKRDAEIRAEVQAMAQAAADEVKRAAAQAAREAFPKDPARASELEIYLTQVPASARRSFRRADDPTGKTVPGTFALDQPEALLPLLPTRVSKFRPGDPLPGRSGWTVTELLGTGGFGEVWLAQHPTYSSLRRAVKFCLDLTDRDRTLLYEGGLMDRVMGAKDMPNIVKLIDAELSGASPWLMYEYVPGGDLVALVAGWRRLSAGDRHTRGLDAIRQVATAVAHFHKLGVVHRDLKPANVLVEPPAAPSEPPVLKVADFGIGGVSASHELAADPRVTSAGVRMATVARGAFTPTYASPQQKKGNAPDARDDVFALGVIGYQLLLGDVAAERPGGKGWRRDLQGQGVKAELLDLLESCWDDDPRERPRDAGDLLGRLGKLGTAPATAARPAPVPPLAPPPVQPPRSRPAPPPPAPPRTVRATRLSSNLATAKCPGCDRTLRFSADTAHSKDELECPSCGTTFVTEVVAQAPPPVPVASSSIPLNCPGCQTTLDVPSTFAGKTIRCTSCKTQIVVPDGTTPARAAPAVWTKNKPAARIARDDDDEDDDRPRKKKPKSTGGAMMAIIAVGTIGLAAIVGAAFYLLAAGSGGATSPAYSTWKK